VGEGEEISAVKLIDRVEIRRPLLSKARRFALSFVFLKAMYPPSQQPQNAPELSDLAQEGMGPVWVM